MAAAARALAALILALAGPGAGAQELGTLFHSPEERQRLDRLRRGDPPEVAAAPLREPQVTGYVKRSDGRHTVWVNGVPVHLANPRVQPPLDPGRVRAYADRDEPAMRVERKPPR